MPMAFEGVYMPAENTFQMNCRRIKGIGKKHSTLVAFKKKTEMWEQIKYG